MERYTRPGSVQDACELLAAHGEDAMVIAGGQTLSLLLRQGLVDPALLVDVSGLDALRGVEEDGDVVSIGAATTYAELRRSSIIEDAFPYFTRALGQVAGPQVRHNGTLGGALCYGDPAIDSAPVLLTLDAAVRLASVDGERSLPLDEFFTGYYETALEPGELLVSVDVPRLSAASWGTYRTMAPRQGDYAIAGVAVRLTFDGETVSTARIGLTNAGDTPMRASEAEDALVGGPVEPASIDAAAAAVRSALDVLDDVQTPKAYKETVFGNLAGQAIRDVDAAREAAAG